MKLLKNMSKEEAKIFYDKLKKLSSSKGFDKSIVNILMSDILFFTDNFTQDY